MATTSPSRALVLIDFINEIVDPDGKLAGKGYSDFIARHGTLDRVATLLGHARGKGIQPIHVRIGFSSDYKEQPLGSPLFGHAGKLGALKLGTWATEFHAKAAPIDGEAILTKHRVNAFVGTALDVLLRARGIMEVAVVGCSTDVGVQTTARMAHDLDYACTVIGDCCAAPRDDDHEATLRMLAKVARVTTLAAFMAQP
ncbi:MAG: cysteine hydrolase [Rhodocyclales bacterium]|nr:cysteine hydrolase [Rhodocyclales bacterium]